MMPTEGSNETLKAKKKYKPPQLGQLLIDVTQPYIFYEAIQGKKKGSRFWSKIMKISF